jgi:hypothetical protein
MDACLGLDVQASEDGSCAPRDKWWNWISLEVNFEEDLNGAPLVNDADTVVSPKWSKEKLGMMALRQRHEP